MNTSSHINPDAGGPNPEMVQGFAQAVRKLRAIGWIEEIGVFGNEAGIVFTNAGKEGLKPLADLWQRVDGFKDWEAVNLFYIAILSRKHSPTAN